MSIHDFLALLGQRVQDKVTGYEGVADSVCFDLYGCVQCSVRHKVGKDNKPADAYWYDHKRLKVLSAKTVIPVPNFDRVGEENGPAEKPTQRG